jgi:hypothetical protein
LCVVVSAYLIVSDQSLKKKKHLGSYQLNLSCLCVLAIKERVKQIENAKKTETDSVERDVTHAAASGADFGLGLGSGKTVVDQSNCALCAGAVLKEASNCVHWCIERCCENWINTSNNR